MKKILAIVILVLLIVGCRQSIPKNWKKITEKYKNGHKATKGYVDEKDNKQGKWTAWRENGNKIYEGYFSDNIVNGKWIFYHENGNVKSKGNFDYGDETGKWITFHENGKKKSEGVHSFDKLIGLWTCWDKNGKIIEENIYDDNGKLIKTIEYQNEKPVEEAKKSFELVIGQALFKSFDNVIKSSGAKDVKDLAKALKKNEIERKKLIKNLTIIKEKTFKYQIIDMKKDILLQKLKDKPIIMLESSDKRIVLFYNGMCSTDGKFQLWLYAFLDNKVVKEVLIIYGNMDSFFPIGLLIDKNQRHSLYPFDVYGNDEKLRIDVKNDNKTPSLDELDKNFPGLK